MKKIKTLSEFIHEQRMYNIKKGMQNVFKTRASFIGGNISNEKK